MTKNQSDGAKHRRTPEPAPAIPSIDFGHVQPFGTPVASQGSSSAFGARKSTAEEGWFMLVLTRKQGEGIAIGYDVVITVVHCGRGRVRISVEAPAWVRIDGRHERFPGSVPRKRLPPKG